MELQAKKGQTLKSQVKMQNVHKWYGSVHALKGVDIEVNPGEVVGLLGDNGAGKSTLIKILTGVISKNKGKIHWEGKEVEISSVNGARRLGIETVYQDQAVINDMSVAQNIFLGREMKKHIGLIEILDKGKMREEARKISEYLGLTIATPDQEVRFCSGGERQGVAIARAIYFKAKLVILDEPTTALSIQGAERVLNFVRRLKKEGIASIIITHNVHHVYPVSDRFVIMSRGEVVARIEKRKISKNELLSKLRPI